jgi:hypothetical protein
MHAGAVNRSSLAVMSKVINSALSHIAAYESDTIAAGATPAMMMMVLWRYTHTIMIIIIIPTLPHSAVGPPPCVYVHVLLLLCW